MINKTLKTLATASLSLLVILFILPTVVSAEQINSLIADIEIRPDSSLEIEETIQYDFEEVDRHGIFRTIPTSYDAGAENRNIFITVQSVTRDGSSEPYQISDQSGNKRIRVGDPNREITGEHTYVITYQVRGALNFFDNDRAELYWDVVGDQWEVPIAEAEAQLRLPQSVAEDVVEHRCFIGEPGATETCPVVSYADEVLQVSTKRSNSFEPGGSSSVESRAIAPGEAMTAVLNFPADLIEKPSFSTQALWFLDANPLIVLPLIVFVLGFLTWFKWGRDPKGRGTIVTQYEPPKNLKPILVGSLIDEKVHSRDITAGIIYLAEQGFISIEKEEQEGWFGSDDYILKQERNFEDIEGKVYRKLATALFAERDLPVTDVLSQLFSSGESEGVETSKSVKLSELKQTKSFSRTIQKIKQDVKQDMRERGWFVKRSKTFNGLLSVAVFGSFFGAVFLLTTTEPTAVDMISLFVAAAIGVMFLMLMKQKTKAGVILQEKLKGFERFLSMTQKERLDFHNAPERKPQEFMEYLPYAIALGVEKKWAEQFADLDIPSPDWYHGTSAFAPGDFAADMSDFSDSYSQAASGSSGTSGGGAGGGMGGGGGGSW